MWITHSSRPGAVPTVLQYVVGVGGVGQIELALDANTAAVFGVKALHQRLVCRTVYS